MSLRYLSVCSGIEAASVAWKPLGWQCAGLSEIEAFPRAVLEHRQGAQAVDWDHRHAPQSNLLPLFGDFTQIEGHHVGPIDLLVGGTPCQSFSIAGLRGGLADDRGNLALEFLRLADRTRPRWLVWENVPGVLSSNGGRDFGAILGGMVELGYGFAYRVLDAQFFGVPQRRRRVFVVGHLGSWQRAAAVLFERHSLSGHPAPRREKGKGFAAELAPSLTASGRGVERTGESRGQDPVVAVHDWPVDIAPTLNAAFGSKQGLEDQHIRGGADCSFPQVAMCLNAGAMGRRDAETETLIPTTGAVFDDALGVAHSLRGEGFDASEGGTGRGTPLVPVEVVGALACNTGPNGHDAGNFACNQAVDAGHIVPVAFSAKDYGADAMQDCSPTLRAGGFTGSHANGGVMPAIAYPLQEVGKRTGASTNDVRAGIGIGGDDDPMFTLQAGAQHGVGMASAVRRLIPEECEALQGFPRGYTAIPWRKKPADECPDGPRYKSLGNSMAVPVMSWLGQRIQQVENLISAQEAT